MYPSNSWRPSLEWRRSLETGELHEDELLEAEQQLIKHAQQESFDTEYVALTKNKTIPQTSRIVNLNPTLDQDGLLRVDGRLQLAEELPFNARFPIILPRKHWTTKLIVKHYHEQGKHSAGTNHVLSMISTRFWIISGREEIREWERQCMECRRRKSSPSSQIMAPLPTSRIETKAFSHVAVDYAGPFLTKQGRGKVRQKRYLCLFTCMACRAVHLEIAFGLDTDSFLNAFYRMVSRRGLPLQVTSDNGTNFVGANRELQELVEKIDEDRVQRMAVNMGIRWNFNPPLAPHFGGVHETMVKSAKRAIYAILSSADITYEELITAFAGAESLINSSPLTYQSANSQDDVPLTPNHFLHGQVGGQFAPESVDNTPFNPRKRWRRIQELMRHFWIRWMQEWIPNLNPRKKMVQSKTGSTCRRHSTAGVNGYASR